MIYHWTLTIYRIGIWNEWSHVTMIVFAECDVKAIVSRVGNRQNIFKSRKSIKPVLRRNNFIQNMAKYTTFQVGKYNVNYNTFYTWFYIVSILGICTILVQYIGISTLYIILYLISIWLYSIIIIIIKCLNSV